MKLRLRSPLMGPLLVLFVSCGATVEGSYDGHCDRGPTLPDLPKAEGHFGDGSDDDSPQTPSPNEFTDLRSYLRFGALHSARLRAAYEEWRAQAERGEQVSTLPDPTFSYGEFLQEVETRTGPQQRRFGLRQAFPWPGELSARGRVEDRRAQAAWRRVEEERAQVLAAIEVAYHEYAFLGREAQLTRELLELLQGLEPVVQGRVRSGGGQQDLLRLQVEIGRVEDDLASIERRRPAHSARLAQAAQLPDDVGVLPLPNLEEPDAQVVDTDELHRLALETSPRLSVLAEELLARQEAEGLASYRRRPRFSVGLDYLQTGAAVNPGTGGSGEDPLLLGVSLSLPVWTRSYAAGEREARHRVRAARERLSAAQAELRAQVEELAYRVDDAGRRMGLYRDTLLPRAREALDLTLAAYRTGSASVLDLIDSERALLEFEKSFWGACREYRQSEARLRGLLGGDAR